MQALRRRFIFATPIVEDRFLADDACGFEQGDLALCDAAGSFCPRSVRLIQSLCRAAGLAALTAGGPFAFGFCFIRRRHAIRRHHLGHATRISVGEALAGGGVDADVDDARSGAATAGRGPHAAPRA